MRGMKLVKPLLPLNPDMENLLVYFFKAVDSQLTQVVTPCVFSVSLNKIPS
jgi:hypothetical protein